MKTHQLMSESITNTQQTALTDFHHFLLDQTSPRFQIVSEFRVFFVIFENLCQSVKFTDFLADSKRSEIGFSRLYKRGKKSVLYSETKLIGAAGLTFRFLLKVGYLGFSRFACEIRVFSPASGRGGSFFAAGPCRSSIRWWS